MALNFDLVHCDFLSSRSLPINTAHVITIKASTGTKKQEIMFAREDSQRGSTSLRQTSKQVQLRLRNEGAWHICEVPAEPALTLCRQKHAGGRASFEPVGRHTTCHRNTVGLKCVPTLPLHRSAEPKQKKHLLCAAEEQER